MNLVTIDEAKLRLRFDGTALDTDIQLMIGGASATVLRHLDNAANAFLLDGDGVPIPENAVVVPDDVKNATLYLVGVMLRDPDGADGKDWDMGYLPRPVTALLMSWRKPPIA
jgi:hypothetical protein